VRQSYPVLASRHEITLLGTETGKAEDLTGELSFPGMALQQPLELNFRSAWKLVSRASGRKIERQVA
jgi:hypothetical protein